MTRSEFLKHAELLQEFILDSIEEFVTGSGFEFDREAYLRESSTDFNQLCVEALFLGSDAYDSVLSGTSLAA